MNEPHRTIAALAALIAATAVPASAQVTSPAHPPSPCAPGERLEQKDLKPGTPPAKDEHLSDKLARTDGVLCPPPVDPEMVERPRSGGAMKVIPPPGAPGGDPTVRPK
jgi:hypothetical protein